MNSRRPDMDVNVTAVATWEKSDKLTGSPHGHNSAVTRRRHWHDLSTVVIS